MARCGMRNGARARPAWWWALLLGCASGSAAGTGAPGARADTAACPLEVPDTRAVASEFPSGVAVTFATDPAHAKEVQERARLMASFYNMKHDPREGPAATPLGSSRTAAPGAAEPLPPSHARVRDLEDGAVLEILPLRGPDLQPLRDEISARWKDAGSTCPADLT